MSFSAVFRIIEKTRKKNCKKNFSILTLEYDITIYNSWLYILVPAQHTYFMYILPLYTLYTFLVPAYNIFKTHVWVLLLW